MPDRCPVCRRALIAGNHFCDHKPSNDAIGFRLPEAAPDPSRRVTPAAYASGGGFAMPMVA